MVVWDDVFELPPGVANAKYSPRIPSKSELWNIACDMVINSFLASAGMSWNEEWQTWAETLKTNAKKELLWKMSHM